MVQNHRFAATIVELESNLESQREILESIFLEFLDSVGFHDLPGTPKVCLSFENDGRLKIFWQSGGPLRFEFWATAAGTSFSHIVLPMLDDPGRLIGELPSGRMFSAIIY